MTETDIKMAIVKNRFDLRLLNHLVQKTGGVNEGIHYYAQIVSPSALGMIYYGKFRIAELNDDKLNILIDAATTLSYFDAFKQCDVFLTGEMMDWYLHWYRCLMETYSDEDFSRLLGLRDFTTKLFEYVEHVHAEGLVGYWRQAKALKLNKWAKELEAEWVRRSK